MRGGTTAPALLGAALAAGCALSLEGTGPDVDAGPDVIDATVPSEGSSDAPQTEAADDAQLDGGPFDSPVDVAFDRGACGPIVVIADDFSLGVNSSAWAQSGPVQPSSGGDGGTGPYVTLIPAGQGGAQASLFYRRVPTSMPAFSASFRFFVDPGGSFPTGDGFTFAWLDGTAGFANQPGAQGLGVPRLLNGWAFGFDAYQNAGPLADPIAPYYGLFQVDMSKGDPGAYNWHTQTAGPLPASVYKTWHTATVTLTPATTSGVVTATIDGTNVLTAVPSTSPFAASFGFTAATGGVSALGSAIDELKITVPNPLCPNAFP